MAKLGSMLVGLAVASAFVGWIGDAMHGGRVALVPEVQAQDTAGAARCSNESLQGRYGVSLTGEVFRVGNANGIGVFTADGKGNLSGTVTGTVAGITLTGPVSGTYHVDDDCTGTGKVTCTTFGVSGEGKLVITSNQQRVLLMYAPPDHETALGIASGVAEKQ